MLDGSLYWLAVSFFRLCVFIWVATRGVGAAETFPDTGRAILASNHLNLADPPLLRARVATTIFMAKLELWSTPLVG